MTFSQLLSVITTFIGTYGDSATTSFGVLGFVYRFVHMFYPSSGNYYDTTGILRLFILISFIGFGIGLFKRLKSLN